MFTPEMVGKVNAKPLGEYAAEELLVVSPDRLARLEGGWNVLAHHDGHRYRIVDSYGRPLYQPTAISSLLLDGVRIDECQRPPVANRTALPRPFAFWHDGREFRAEPVDEADAPHVVEQQR